MGIGRRDFGVVSIEFKILSSDLDRENSDDVDDDVSVCDCAMRGGRKGGKGGGS
jgi:hypothetical protein